ncbi:unnamed protein product [Prorocentrum cordatum]|uniref:Uncharacterized protein n=1 Tax=Prorocentrum cordatum TaxID=2364126 RepID=A0ABN9SX19_9DINO|nr:unnamed protein product [Polarella glacialis]
MFSALGLWDETEDQETQHDKPLRTERAHGARQSTRGDVAHNEAALSHTSEPESPVAEGWDTVQAVCETFGTASAALGEALDVGAAAARGPPAPGGEAAAVTSPEEPARAALAAPLSGGSRSPRVAAGRQLRELLAGGATSPGSAGGAAPGAPRGRWGASGGPGWHGSSLLEGALIWEEATGAGRRAAGSERETGAAGGAECAVEEDRLVPVRLGHEKPRGDLGPRAAARPQERSPMPRVSAWALPGAGRPRCEQHWGRAWRPRGRSPSAARSSRAAGRPEL